MQLGAPFSGSGSVLPTVISNIPKLGNLFDLINVLMIFRSEHNCLHDDMAGTRVIRERVEPFNPGGQVLYPRGYKPVTN